MNTVCIVMRGSVAAVRQVEGGGVIWACRALPGRESLALLAAWEWCQSRRLVVLGDDGRKIEAVAA